MAARWPLKTRAAHQSALHRFHPSISANDSPPTRRRASSRGAQLSAFDAKAPIVALAITQAETLGQVLGIWAADRDEPFDPRRERGNLCVSPAADVTLVCLLG